MKLANEIVIDKVSPFTGGRVFLVDKDFNVDYRGEAVSGTRKVYHCEDTGHEFTDDELDTDFMWLLFRKWCEKNNITTSDLEVNKRARNRRLKNEQAVQVD